MLYKAARKLDKPEMFLVRLFGLMALATEVLCAPPCSLPTQIEGYGWDTRVCVDDLVTFTCTASSNATTVLRWTSDVFGSLGPAYMYFSNPGDTAPITRESYNLSLVATAPVLQSRAAVGALLRLNGTTVSCAETTNGASYSNISTGCLRFAAPPSDLQISLTSCTTDSATLQWSGPLSDGGSNVTRFTLSSDPPTRNCNGSCAVDAATLQYSFSDLQPGVPYTLSVRADNCGGKQQGVQSNTSVAIPVPLPLNISVCSVHDAATNQIHQLSTTWSPLPGAWLNDRLQCTPLGNYTVTYRSLSGIDGQNMSVLASSCSPNCSSLIDVKDSNSTPVYMVSVGGIGIPGAFQTIASTNNILKVDVVNWTQSVTINCTFLSGLVGTSGCVVSFGTSPDYLPFTLISSQRGGSGQSITIPLVINGAPLDLRTSYFYTASLLSANSTNQCVIVRGSLCGLAYLGAVLTNGCHCPDGNFSADISNGCLCFNGITPGSQAKILCDAGYQLLGNSTLLCHGNGSWSSLLPRCEKQGISQVGHDSGRAGVIAGAVVGSVLAFFCLLALTCIAAKMVHISVTRKAKGFKAAVDHDGIERSTELSSSISYPLGRLPQPPPLTNISNNEKEWAAIMNVVQDAASPTI